MSDAMPKLDALTSLRFVAAASIVTFHLRAFGFHTELSLGVSFFFVLSGFILAYNYRHLDKSQIRSFYVHRIARIVPVHLFMLLLSVLLLGKTGGLLVVIANALLLHSWIPSESFFASFNGVSWSISDEMAFYLLFPLLIRARDYRPVLIFITGLVAAQLFAVAAAPSLESDWLSLQGFVLRGPTVRIFEFALGVGCGRLFADGLVPRIKEAPPATALELAAMVLVIAFAAANQAAVSLLGLHELPVGRWFTQCGTAPAFAVLIVVFAQQSGFISRALRCPFLVRLGEISFSTYMVHVVLIWLAGEHGLDGLFATWPWAIVGYVVIYAASYALWRFIEVPCRNAILRASTSDQPFSTARRTRHSSINFDHNAGSR